MANTINNVKDVGSIISTLAAGMLADEFQFIKTIDKEPESSFGKTNGYNNGDTITINKPARFTMGTTADITSTIQDVTEEKITMALDKTRNIAVNLTSAEIATDLSLASWAERILKPAMSRLAQGIESECLILAKDATYNSVGTGGSTVFDMDTMLAAGQKLQETLVPTQDDLYALLNPAASRSAVNARKGLFQSNDEISKQYKKGVMGVGDGFTYLRNNLLPTHTNGNDIVFEVRTTVSTEGQSTLVVEALTTTTGTVKKGTVFTIGAVYGVHPIAKVSTGQLQQFVNPQTRQSTGSLQQFVVTADATADGSGYATLSVSPAFYTSTSLGLQNIDAFPVDGAAITPVGGVSSAYTQNLAYAKQAFRFVSVPLMKPDGVHMASQSTVNGISVRAIQAYQTLTDKMVLRLDVLYGFAAVRPEWACRITA